MYLACLLSNADGYSDFDCQSLGLSSFFCAALSAVFFALQLDVILTFRCACLSVFQASACSALLHLRSLLKTQTLDRYACYDELVFQATLRPTRSAWTVSVSHSSDQQTQNTLCHTCSRGSRAFLGPLHRCLVWPRSLPLCF